MSLDKRGNLWHYDFIVGGDRYRGTTKCTSKTAARAFEENVRRSVSLGTPPRSNLTLGQVASRWWVARAADLKTAPTIAIRLQITLQLLGANTPIEAIGMAEIADAMQRRRVEPTRQGRLPTNSTVNRDLIDTTMSPIMTYAAETLELSVKKIVWRTLKLREPKGRDRTFTAIEIAAWRAALPSWHRDTFDFCKRYGVRLQAAFFPIECVDAQAGRINMPKGKNGLSQSILLLPEDQKSIALIYARAKVAGLKTLWFRQMADKRLRATRWRGFQHASRTALDTAGIKDTRPVHDLRHHAGTTLVRETGNLAAAKKLLGHQNIQSTMRYVHADDSDVFEAMSEAYVTKSTTKAG